MKRLFLPDYQNNIITIPATLLEYAGVKNKYPKNNELKQELAKDYKNVVFLILDGLGEHSVRNFISPDSFLNRFNRGVLSSVFPPTTTAATITYSTCLYPGEHGWLGWSMYFREVKKCIDLFNNRDSFSQAPLEGTESIAYDNFPLKNIYSRMEEKNIKQIYDVSKDYIKERSKNSTEYESVDDLFENLERICKLEGEKIVFSYYYEPDSIMHKFGYSSPETIECIEDLNNRLEDLYNKVEDTLIIVTADHGQIDIENRYLLHEYHDLCDCLKYPPSIDSRAQTYFIKRGKKKDFANLFRKYFGKEFVLLSKKQVQELNLFGSKINIAEDFIGDFLAIGVGQSVIQFMPKDLNRELFPFKGHHAGLTQQEMEVPLILCGKKQ